MIGLQKIAKQRHFDGVAVCVFVKVDWKNGCGIGGRGFIEMFHVPQACPITRAKVIYTVHS